MAAMAQPTAAPSKLPAVRPVAAPPANQSRIRGSWSFLHIAGSLQLHLKLTSCQIRVLEPGRVQIIGHGDGQDEKDGCIRKGEAA